MADKKMPMVAWFNPRQLADTAVRVAISSVFGQFADRREAFAAANPIDAGALDDHCDYRKHHREGEDFWFDYVADTGDGWNPTYAVARLLAEDGLELAGVDPRLPRGRLLIMGGDEVYPTAKQHEYENRLLYPYQHAYQPGGPGTPARWPDDERPDLFAMPGNHDWYDGLKTFFHFFCRRTIRAPGEAEVERPGRVIGGRRTHQTRSYFALKLPGNWWLWGSDNQLDHYIDQPQIDFFQYVAQHWMAPRSKLILCTGTPDWQYVSRKGEESFTTHSYLERLATDAVDQGHELKLVLSGDSHHYVRYREGERDYITCGGGGAFLHPTHKLKNQEFNSKFPPPGVAYEEAKSPYGRQFRIANKLGPDGEEKDEEAIYPSRAVSRGLASGNIGFAFTNWQLTATLAVLYFFFFWLLDFNARVADRGSLVAALQGGGWRDAFRTYGELVLYSPWTVLLCLLSVVGYTYFADAKGLTRLGIGIVHGVLQAAAVTLVAVVLFHCLGSTDCGRLCNLGLRSLAALAAAFVSATIVGLYLWAMLAWFGKHGGHFSSLRVQDYKSFLRLRIDGDGALHVYPVGLDRVPRDDGRPEPRLIEGPITIPPPKQEQAP